MKIRRYNSKDSIEPLISRAVKDIEPEHYSEGQQSHLEEVIPEMNLEFAGKDRYNYFIAVKEDEIIGVAGFQNESGTLAGIFVKPELKGSGIGSKLMDRIEEDARSQGLEEMEILASLEAVGFYKKKGYKVTEEKKHDIEDKDIGIKVMRKEL